MIPGIYQISAKDYHTAPGISNSLLGRLHPTPLHFKSEPRPKTDALEFGECLHSLLLDKTERWYIQPEFRDELKTEKWNNNAKVCREWNDTHSDKPILTLAEDEMVKAMRDSVHAHPFAGPALSGAATEQSIFVIDPGTNLLLKCRIDAIPKEGRISGAKPLLDVKSCRRADKFSFEREIANRHYHRQAAFYLDIARMHGMDVDSFMFIAVEKTPPYAVAVWDLDLEAIQQGRREYRRLINIYDNCVRTGVWNGYGDSPKPIGLPEYAYDLELT